MVHIYNRIVLSHKKEYFLIFNHIYIKKIFFCSLAFIMVMVTKVN